jgi:hypothetical protein
MLRHFLLNVQITSSLKFNSNKPNKYKQNETQTALQDGVDDNYK